MSTLLEGLPAEYRAVLRDAPSGADLAARPMLATLSDLGAPPGGSWGSEFPAGAWIFERKLDGVRLLAVREGGRVRLLSRTGQPLNGTYPEVADSLAAQESADFTVDGEIVAFTAGRTDFSRLQQRLQLTDPDKARASGVAVFYYVFDVLRLDGKDVRPLPLRTRKSLLRRALRFDGPLRFTTHRNEGGQPLLDEACRRGWEGLIAKVADGPYVTRRSMDWLKLKCAKGQEFVVGGFTEPSGSRVGFGALLLGYYEEGRLRYAGKAGTGYDQATLLGLRSRLDELAAQRSPFAEPVREKGAHWASPELVAEIGFTEWTREGKLRHPRFLGLREDKKPRDVVRERPRPA